MSTTKKAVIPSVARIIRDIVTPDGFTKEVRIEPKTHWSPAIKVLVLKSENVLIEIWFDSGKDRSEAYMLASGHVTFDTPAGKRTFDRTGVDDSFYIDNPNKLYRDRLWQGERVVAPGKLFGTVMEAAGYKEFGENRKNSWSDKIEILWDNGVLMEYKNEKELTKLKVKKADVIEQANAQIKRFIETKIPEAIARIANSESVPGIPFMVTPDRKKTVTQNLRNGSWFDFRPSGFGIGYRLMPMKHAKKHPYVKRADEALEKFFSFSPIFIETFDCD